MRSTAWSAAWAVGVGLVFSAGDAVAHGLDADRIDVVLRGETAELVAAAPAAFLGLADDNRDGRLERTEVRAHREELRSKLSEAVGLTDQDGRPGETELLDVSTPEGTGPNGESGSDHLRLTLRVRWPDAPSALRVRCDYASDRSITLIARRARPSSTPGVLEWVGGSEAVRLGPDHVGATVLAMPAAPPAVAVAISDAPHDADRTPTWLAVGAAALLIALVTSFTRSPRRFV